MPTPPISVFVSYAHKDKKWLNDLRVRLQPLVDDGEIEVWDDQEIRAGEDWDGEISEHLLTAHIIFVLMSPDFMASKYCRKGELAKASERKKAGEAFIVPVNLRNCDWREAAGLQFVPNEPIATTEDKDSAWKAIITELEKIIEKILHPALRRPYTKEELSKPGPGDGWEMIPMEALSAVTPNNRIAPATPLDLGMTWGLERGPFTVIIATRKANKAAGALVCAEDSLWRARKSVSTELKLSTRWWMIVEPQLLPNGPRSFPDLVETTPNPQSPIPRYIGKHGVPSDTELGLLIQLDSSFDICTYAGHIRRWIVALNSLAGAHPAVLVEVSGRNAGAAAMRLKDSCVAENPASTVDLAVSCVDADSVEEVALGAASSQLAERRQALTSAIHSGHCLDFFVDTWLNQQKLAQTSEQLLTPREWISSADEPTVLDALAIGLLRRSTGPSPMPDAREAFSKLKPLLAPEIAQLARLIDGGLSVRSFLGKASTFEVSLALRARVLPRPPLSMLDAVGTRSPGPWWALCAWKAEESLLTKLLTRPAEMRAVLGLVSEEERRTIARDATRLERIELCRRGRPFRRSNAIEPESIGQPETNSVGDPFRW